MSENWYEHVDADSPLTQGDLVSDCPLLAWKPDPVQFPSLADPGPEMLRAAMNAIRADVVVLTQACDLEHNKVANVILCPHVALEEYREAWTVAMQTAQQNPTTRAWQRHCEDIRDGFNWNLAILNAENWGELGIVHRVVDFHGIFSVPRTFVESLLTQRRRRRLRLLPPYREHLSQAFARFFMRVGLPVPIIKAW